MSSFAGQSVVITGAARGIGRALAVAMADAGADVVGVDLNTDALADTAAAVQGTGQVFHGYACDISDGPAVQALADRLRADGRPVDVLIANAGVLSSGRFVEAAMAHWQRLIEVNLLGTMHCCHALLPLLAAGSGGRILAMASVAGKVGTPGMAAYAA
ncbi:MAG: SDR family NAD(P)-dependent oxidoreductase, partial [Bacteroidetes bacterium]|nr:SDR family NAD(P)-dependent oxidoreductase [Bacteroidota bacterium]